MFRNWFKRCCARMQVWICPPHGKTSGRRPRFVRLSVDPLEERELLSNYVWVGGTGNNWSTLANWEVGGVQPNQPPGASDAVTFDNSAGNNTASTVDQNFSINSLQIDTSWRGTLNLNAGATLTLGANPGAATGFIRSATVQGAGNLRISGGTTECSSSTVSGTGAFTVASGATFAVENPTTVDTRAVTVSPGGTFRWDAGNITLRNGAHIDNGGGFTINQGGTLTGDGSPNVALNNSGAVSSAVGAAIQVPFNNSSTLSPGVIVTSGILNLQGGGTIQGTYRILANAQLSLLNNGPLGQNVNYDLTGATFNGDVNGVGTLFLRSDAVISSSTVTVNTYFTFYSGTIDNDGNIVFNNDVVWYAGTLTYVGTATLSAGVTANIIYNASGSAALTGGATFINRGLVQLGGNPSYLSTFWMDDNSVLENRGTFSILDDSGIGTTGGQPVINSYGVFQKTGGTGTSNIYVPTNEYPGATTRRTSGALRFRAGYTLQANALLDTGGGAVVVDGTLEQDGGTTNIGSGSLTVNGQYLFAGGTATLAGGTLSATLGVQIQTGATLSGNGTVTANVSNAGDFITGAADGSSPGTITVAGNYTQSAGSTTVNGELDVTGTFEQDGGTTTINSGNPVFTAAAFVQTGGDFQVQNAQNFQVSGNYTMSGGTAEFLYTSATINGQLLVNGGTLQLDHVPTVTVSGGVQIGSGGYLQFFGGGISGDVSNAGTLALDTTSNPACNNDAGIIGNYTQTSTGVLLAAAGPYGYDQLSVNGQASLAGTFELLFADGYDPGPGSVFVPLSYVSRSGTFDGLSLPSLSNGTWDPRYDDPNYPNGFSLWIDP